MTKPLSAQPKLVDYPTHWIFGNQFVGLEQHEKALAENRRLREALGVIVGARTYVGSDGHPQIDGVPLVKIARDALDA